MATPDFSPRRPAAPPPKAAGVRVGGDLPCPRCAAVIPAGAPLCTDCGTAADAPASRSAEERRLATEALRRAIRTIDVVRTWFLAASVGLGVALAGAVLLLAAGRLPATVGILAAAATGIAFAGVLLLRRLVPLHPFPCAVAFGAALTAWAAFVLLSTDSEKYLVLAAAFWSLVPPTWRVRGLLREFPDLYEARLLRGERRETDPAAAVSRLRERLRRERSRSLRRILAWSGCVAAAGVLAAAAVAWSAKAPPADPAVRRFEEDWRAGAWDGVKSLFDEGARARMGKGLDVLLDRRGWRRTPPPLGPVELSRDGAVARARFPVEGGEVRTDWAWRDGRWVLTGLRLPER